MQIDRLTEVQKRLVSDDPTIRRVAVRDLADLGVDGVAHLLAKALQDEDASVRKEAAGSIDEFEPSEIAEVLIDALASEDHAVRSAAAQALANIKDAATVPALSHAVQSDDPFVIASSLGALKNFRPMAIRQRALDLLGHPESSVRREAVIFLGYLRDDSALSGLLRLAKDDASDDVRKAALGAIQFSNSERVANALISALADSQWWVRSEAAVGLGRLKYRAAISALMEVAVNDIWQVQEKAVFTLGTLHAVESLNVLIACFQSEVSNLRKAVIAAAGEIAHPSFRTLIMAAEFDDDPDVRKIAKWALSQLVEFRGDSVSG